MNVNHKSQRYHVYMGNRRTTVTLDDSLAFFMALNLDHETRTPQAKQAIETMATS